MKFLEDYRIIDLGQVIAGTIGGLILADFGADVIKVESPSGDIGRNPNIAGVGDVSGIFLTFNRGKKGLVIDLKSDEGKKVFLDLVTVSDAVIANFRPGTLDRLGIGFEEMKKYNSDIIFVDSSGYGEEGPWRDKPAFDVVEQAMSGHMAITGEPGGPPLRNGSPTADISTALYTAIACMAGLLGKQKGKGAKHFEVPMFDVQLSMLGYISTMYLNNGDIPQPPGSAHEYMVPYQAFPTATIYIVLSPREERFYKKMCEVMEIPEYATDPRFVTNDLRVKNKDELLPKLEEILLQKPGEEWCKLFEDAGVPAAPVNTLDRALDNEQVEKRSLIKSFKYPGSGDVRVVGNPIMDIGSEKSSTCDPAPMHGEHTIQILRETLGYEKEIIDSLLDKNVVQTEKKFK